MAIDTTKDAPYVLHEPCNFPKERDLLRMTRISVPRRDTDDEQHVTKGILGGLLLGMLLWLAIALALFVAI